MIDDHQLFAAIDREVPETRAADMLEEGQHELAAVAVLDVGRVDHHGDYQSERIDQKVSLAAIDLFARIVTMRAPLSVVFTDWLSISAALGCRSRPTDSRTSPWRQVLAMALSIMFLEPTRRQLRSMPISTV